MNTKNKSNKINPNKAHATNVFLTLHGADNVNRKGVFTVTTPIISFTTITAKYNFAIRQWQVIDKNNRTFATYPPGHGEQAKRHAIRLNWPQLSVVVEKHLQCINQTLPPDQAYDARNTLFKAAFLAQTAGIRFPQPTNGVKSEVVATTTHWPNPFIVTQVDQHLHCTCPIPKFPYWGCVLSQTKGDLGGLIPAFPPDQPICQHILAYILLQDIQNQQKEQSNA